MTSPAESKEHRLAVTVAPSVDSFLMLPASEHLATIVIKAQRVVSGSAQPSSGSTTPTGIQTERAVKYIFQHDTKVINIEVMWCLNAVMTHASFRAAVASAYLFPWMFPSSATAKKVQFGKYKWDIPFSIALCLSLERASCWK